MALVWLGPVVGVCTADDGDALVPGVAWPGVRVLPREEERGLSGAFMDSVVFGVVTARLDCGVWLAVVLGACEVMAVVAVGVDVDMGVVDTLAGGFE